MKTAKLTVLKGEDAYHLGGKPKGRFGSRGIGFIDVTSLPSRHLVVQLYAEILPK